MKIKLTPHKEGEKMEGLLCLPCAHNLPDEEDVKKTHPGWELTACPVCGRGCWLTPRAHALLAAEAGIRGMCTDCALRAGAKAQGGGRP